jgi:hypothetical protein
VESGAVVLEAPAEFAGDDLIASRGVGVGTWTRTGDGAVQATLGVNLEWDSLGIGHTLALGDTVGISRLISNAEEGEDKFPELPTEHHSESHSEPCFMFGSQTVQQNYESYELEGEGDGRTYLNPINRPYDRGRS